MPSVVALREGRYAVLEADIGEHGRVALGVLLEDPESDRLWIRLRRDIAALDPGDPVLPLLEDDLNAKAAEMGARRFFEWAEDSWSANLRTTDRRTVAVADFNRTLARLFSAHVATPFGQATHVPRYSLRSAAGQFLDNAEAEVEGYEELPAAIRTRQGLFAAHIEGTSMEPHIPDGSVALFEFDVKGSRQNRLVLVEESGSRYTLKRYTSRKAQSEDGSWRHDQIVLEPLNPEHEPIVLAGDESRYRVVAWFVDVLY